MMHTANTATINTINALRAAMPGLVRQTNSRRNARFGSVRVYAAGARQGRWATPGTFRTLDTAEALADALAAAK